MREEIALLAPASVGPGTITEEKLALGAVTRDVIKEKTIDGTRIAEQAIGREQLAPAAVGADQLAPESVTGEKAGVGILKIVDASGVEIDMTGQIVTAAQYAQAPQSPNIIYLVTDG